VDKGKRKGRGYYQAPAPIVNLFTPKALPAKRAPHRVLDYC
jgi:hypothetical protein